MKKANMIAAAAVPLTERPTVTVDEFCGMIGIARSTFYKAVDAGDLKPSYYGKRVFIKQDEWKRFVKNMTVKKHDDRPPDPRQRN